MEKILEEVILIFCAKLGVSYVIETALYLLCWVLLVTSLRALNPNQESHLCLHFLLPIETELSVLNQSYSSPSADADSITMAGLSSAGRSYLLVSRRH